MADRRYRAWHYLVKAAGWAALCSLAAGCGHDPPVIDTERLRIAADADANANSPVAVDLVFAMDSEALGGVADLAAAQWFRERTQIELAAPTGLRVRSFELPPRHSIEYGVDSDEEDAIGIFVFADYPSPGTHRARLDRLAAPTVRLGRTTFAVEPGE